MQVHGDEEPIDEHGLSAARSHIEAPAPGAAPDHVEGMPHSELVVETPVNKIPLIFTGPRGVVELIKLHVASTEPVVVHMPI